MPSFLPDVAQLDDQLAQARGARDHLDELIAWLERGVELLGPREADAPLALPAVAPAPPKPKPLRPAAKATGRDAEAKVLSVILAANRPLSRAQIVDASGLAPGQVKGPLQRLVADGKVKATGVTKSRRYEAGEHRPHTAKRAQVDTGTARIAAQEKAAVMRIAERERVTKAIAADSGKLNDSRLAAALSMDVDDVADACDALLSRGAIRRDGDGTYWRVTSTRAVAA
jgi:hypothetical protein